MQRAWTTLRATEGVGHLVIGSMTLDRETEDDAIERERLRTMRRMILYSTEADEMHTPLALSLMNPRRFDFNPRFFQYGGLLIYGCGLMIFLAGLAGLLPLSGGLAAYLLDPDRMGVLYMAARIWPLALTSLLPVLAYRTARLMMPRRDSLLIALLSLIPPGVYYYGAVLKPSAPGAILALLPIFFSIKVAKAGRMRDFVGSGLGIGLAAAIFPTRFITAAGVFVASLLALQHVGRRAIRGLALSAVVSVAVFILFNPYWILDSGSLMEDIRFGLNWLRPNPTPARITMILLEIVPKVTSLSIVLVGVASVIMAMVSRKPTQLVLAAHALAAFLYYAYQSSGYGVKHGGQNARYFILLGPLGIIMMGAMVSQWTAWRRSLGMIALTLIALTALPSSILAVRNNWSEASLDSTRYQAGRWITANLPAGTVIHVAGTPPAPYTIPFFRLDRHPIRQLSPSDSLPAGGYVVTVSKLLEIGAAPWLRDCELIREFPSHRMIAGFGPFPETITYSNARVRLWRRRMLPLHPANAS